MAESSLAAALAPLQLSHVSRPPGSLERLTHTQRPTHCLNLLGDTHRQRLIHTQAQIHTHTQRPTHCLNSLDLTLHTDHLTDNSHSDFLRDEKCFRATRRLVLLVCGVREAANMYVQIMPPSIPRYSAFLSSGSVSTPCAFTSPAFFTGDSQPVLLT